MESGSNPADEGSRGVNAKDFIWKLQLVRGPEFWWQTEDRWSQQRSCENEIQVSSLEVKKVTANTKVIEEYRSMLSRFERFCNWQALRMELCSVWNTNGFKDEHQHRKRSCKTESCPAAGIVVQDLGQAEVEILKVLKRDALDKEDLERMSSPERRRA